MVGTWITILVLFGTLIVSEVYCIGKYLGNRYEIFNNNFFAQVSLGAIFYFVITFALFLPLIWLEANFVIFVVFFFLKDFLQIVFLLTRRQYLKNLKKDFLKLGILIVLAVITVAFYNEVLTLLRPLSKSSSATPFQMWESFKKMIYRLDNMPEAYVENWFAGMLVAFLGISIIFGTVNQFVHRASLLTYGGAALIMVGTLMAFNFERPLESLAGNYILIFAFQNAINIIRFSRRRYGAIFSLVVLASWAFDPNYFLCMLVIAFISSTYYSLIKKPKPILFWIQMMAPLAVVSTLWINELSRPAGAILTTLAILSYAFIIAAGRLESMEKLNNLVIKLRFIIPIVILIIIGVASISIGVVKADETIDVIKNRAFLFDDYNNLIVQYCQYAVLFAIGAGILAKMIILKLRGTDWSKQNVAGLALIGLAIAFAVNPGFVTLINNVETFRNQQIYLSPLVLPILGIVMLTNFANKMQSKLPATTTRSKQNVLLTFFR